jgi:hypothetical protein
MKVKLWKQLNLIYLTHFKFRIILKKGKICFQAITTRKEWKLKVKKLKIKKVKVNKIDKSKLYLKHFNSD